MISIQSRRKPLETKTKKKSLKEKSDSPEFIGNTETMKTQIGSQEKTAR